MVTLPCFAISRAVASLCSRSMPLLRRSRVLSRLIIEKSAALGLADCKDTSKLCSSENQWCSARRALAEHTSTLPAERVQRPSNERTLCSTCRGSPARRDTVHIIAPSLTERQHQTPPRRASKAQTGAAPWAPVAPTGSPTAAFRPSQHGPCHGWPSVGAPPHAPRSNYYAFQNVATPLGLRYLPTS